jgi:hypothetical protein
MKYFRSIFILLSIATASLISACSGEQPMEKAILGTWLQDTPTSTTAGGLQTITAGTVLRIKKNGETHLTRNLDITGQDLPETGVRINVDIKGQWELGDGQLKQTPSSVIILPRESDEGSRVWANQLQAQAEQSPPSVKAVISVDKDQLILQDVDLGTTDIYRRK